MLWVSWLQDQNIMEKCVAGQNYLVHGGQEVKYEEHCKGKRYKGPDTDSKAMPPGHSQTPRNVIHLFLRRISKPVEWTFHSNCYILTLVNSTPRHSSLNHIYSPYKINSKFIIQPNIIRLTFTQPEMCLSLIHI